MECLPFLKDWRETQEGIKIFPFQNFTLCLQNYVFGSRFNNNYNINSINKDIVTTVSARLSALHYLCRLYVLTPSRYEETESQRREVTHSGSSCHNGRAKI